MKVILCFILLIPAAARAGTPKYSAVDGALAVPISEDNAYFRNPANPAYDYWNLSGYYVPQSTVSSCLAAAVSMALNALLSARRQRGDEEENIAEGKLTEKVSGVPWQALVSTEGADGRHGLTLAQLAAASSEAMAAYGALEPSVSSVTAASQSAQALESFRKALAENERNPLNIMLLHFTQDTLTGAPGGPYAHISPVGAYDEKPRRVLIFDVDRQWYEPYWAADIQVLKAMAVKTKAFGVGGYVLLNALK